MALGPTYNYAQRAFSITAAPLTGTLGKMKTVDDIAVSWSGNSDWEADEGRNQHVYVFRTNLNNGNFSSFGDAKEVFKSSNPITKTAVVAADFIGEGVELETPTHLKLQGDRTYAAIIQTPPYHVDYIPVPWNDDEKSLTNFTYSPALKSTYTHSKNSSKSQDVNFNINATVETIADLKPSSVAIMKKAAAFAIQKFTGIDAGAILDQLVDQVNTTKDEVDKSYRKTLMTDSIETSTHDRILYYTTDTHLWRYPIKEPVPLWLFSKPLEGDTGEAESDKFLTFSICDDPVVHTTAGLEDSAYQPLHEEGNLFSYPTSIAQNEGYVNRKLTLTDQGSITYSPGSHTHTVNVTESASNVKTETKEVTYGMISKLVGTVKVMSGNASGSAVADERGYTANFTKIYSTTDTLTASFPNPTGDYANVTFTTDMQAYADEAGILTLGFAVSNFGSTAQLWTDSVYNKTPDPALYLPSRFFINGSTVSARTNEASATKVRGIRFFIPETSKYSGPVLYAGEKYRIDVPIYNASFVAPSEPVEVSISYSKKGERVVTPIETKSVNLGGWEQGKDSNKAMLHFDWTVPEDMSPGQKELYVYIDPDNKIKEIHEEWTAETPGGNNSGYFPFSVVSATGLNAGNSALKADDFAVKINGMDMADFIAYAAKSPEPFDAECVITNRGKNNLVLFSELSMIASDDEEIESFTGSVGVFNTGESGSFFFIVYPEDWKKCKELEATFYTENDAVAITASANGTKTPAPETPGTETPGTETPGTETPAPETPDAETPVVENGIGSAGGGCETVRSYLLLGFLLGLMELALLKFKR